MKIINNFFKEIRYCKTMLQLVPISRIVRLPTWESWEKRYLGVTIMVNYREYYKGEGDGVLHVRIVMRSMNMCTKSVIIMH
jgi:hypothetical protein